MKKLLEPDSQTKGLPGLWYIRSHLNLTQQKLAEISGLSTVAIRHVETGVRDCSQAFQRRLAEVLACTVADLHQEPGEFRLLQIEIAYHRATADRLAKETETAAK